MNVINYPSAPLWMRRLMYAAVVSMIGVNLYISQVQSRLWTQAQEVARTIIPFTPSATSIARVADSTLIYSLQKLEHSRFGLVAAQLGVPSSADIQVHTKRIRQLDNTVREMHALLRIAGVILRWTSILVWIGIGRAVLWLLVDLEKGKAKLFTALLLIAAMAMSIWSYHLLVGFHLPI